MLVGGAFALAGMGFPPEDLPVLVIPGLFIALIGLVTMVFAAAAARFQLRVMEWHIRLMGGESGPRIVRGIGILILVAFLAGLFFAYALGGQR
jgi:hypothetical protein